MKLNKLVLIPVLAFLIFLCQTQTACNNKKEKRVTEQISIGAINSLSGKLSDLGIPSSNGAQLAVTHLNEAGGVLGQQINLVIKDSKSDTSEVKKMVDQIMQQSPEVCAFLGLSDSDLARSAAREAGRHNRVFLTSGATSPLLPIEVPEYLFLACFGDNVQAAAAAEWAYNELQGRTVTVVYDSIETYTLLLHQYFIERFESLGGVVNAIQAYNPADMSQVGQKLPPADFVFLAAEGANEALRGIQQLRKAGITSPIVGGDGFDSEKVWEAHPEIQDVFYATHIYLGSDNPSEQVRNFREAYSQTYGGSVPDAFAALGYDAVNIIAQAIIRAGSAAPDTIAKSLAGTENFQGLTGTISFTGGNHVPRKSVTIIEIKDGNRIFKTQLIPKAIPDP